MKIQLLSTIPICPIKLNYWLTEQVSNEYIKIKKNKTKLNK
jgi:hypothetical protein